MNPQGSIRSLAAAVAALSLATSSVASAAPAVVGRVSPLVALSVFGSAQSRAALCTAGAATVAAAAATAAQGQPGCVLPVLDAPPPVVVAEAPPPMMMAAPAPAVGPPNLLPLLLALGAFAAVFFLLDDEILGHGGHVNFPTSPA